MSKLKAGDFYEFLDGNVEHANVFLDPATQDKTRLMKVISVTRKASGRVARIGLNITQPKPRDIEIELDEALARAIVKVFDDAPEKPEPGLTQTQERELEASQGAAKPD